MGNGEQMKTVILEKKRYSEEFALLYFEVYLQNLGC